MSLVRPPGPLEEFAGRFSTWDAEAITGRRLELLASDPATAPHKGGVLVIDETGDRKDGTQTAHVGRQDLGSIGKTDNGIVALSSLWADERVYYPLHVRPSIPASRLPHGKADPGFRTKPQLAVERWSAAPSPSAGVTGATPPPERSAARSGPRRPGLPRAIGRAEEIGPPASGAAELPSWPRALRRVRGRLDPWTALQRRWRAWSSAPSPPEIQALLRSLAGGRPRNRYLRL